MGIVETIIVNPRPWLPDDEVNALYVRILITQEDIHLLGNVTRFIDRRLWVERDVELELVTLGLRKELAW